MMGRAPTFARSRRKPLAFIGAYFCDLLLYFTEALAYLLIKLLKPPPPGRLSHGPPVSDAAMGVPKATAFEVFPLGWGD